MGGFSSAQHASLAKIRGALVQIHLGRPPELRRDSSAPNMRPNTEGCRGLVPFVLFAQTAHCCAIDWGHDAYARAGNGYDMMQDVL